MAHDHVRVDQLLYRADDLIICVMDVHGEIHRPVGEIARLTGGNQRTGRVFDVNKILQILQNVHRFSIFSDAFLFQSTLLGSRRFDTDS